MQSLNHCYFCRLQVVFVLQQCLESYEALPSCFLLLRDNLLTFSAELFFSSWLNSTCPCGSIFLQLGRPLFAHLPLMRLFIFSMLSQFLFVSFGLLFSTVQFSKKVIGGYADIYEMDRKRNSYLTSCLEEVHSTHNLVIR